LPEAKGLNELTLRVLEGERDRVYGRDRQSSPLNSHEKGTANGDAGQIDFPDDRVDIPALASFPL
jgi:hypothetical protein